MLAKAGESDRAIRVKMVRFAFVFSYFEIFIWVVPRSPGHSVSALFHFLCFIFDANLTLIFLHLYTIFLAEASLLWEAQGRQDQPPIDTIWDLAGGFYMFCQMKMYNN
jgi:hypothetical protein